MSFIYQFAKWSDPVCWGKGGRCCWVQEERNTFFHHPTPHSDQKHTAERNGERALNVNILSFAYFWTLTITSISTVCVYVCALVCVPAFSVVSVSVLEVWCSVLLSGRWAAKWPEPESHWTLVACISVLTAGSLLPTHINSQTEQSRTVITLNNYITWTQLCLKKKKKGNVMHYLTCIVPLFQ